MTQVVVPKGYQYTYSHDRYYSYFGIPEGRVTLIGMANIVYESFRGPIVRLANYKSLIRNHMNALNEYARSESVIKIIPDLATIRVSDGGIGRYQNTSSIYAGLAIGTVYAETYYPSLSSETNSRLVFRFTDKVRALHTSMNGATFAAELGKTIKGITSPGKALRRSVGHYLDDVKNTIKGLPKYQQRRKRRDAALEALSGTYLEYKFQWDILQKDVTEAYKALDAAATQVVTKAVYATEHNQIREITTESVDGVIDPGSDFYVKQRITEKFRHESGRMFGIMKRAVNAPSIPQSFGLTPENWVPALYEVIPWSFVFDYFTSLGSVIGAGCTSTSDLFVIGRTSRFEEDYSERYVPDTDRSIAKWVNLGYKLLSFNHAPGSISHKRFCMRREAVSQKDFWVRPVLQIPGSSTKWLNLLALSVQAKVAQNAVLDYTNYR